MYPILSNAEVSYCVDSAPSEQMTSVIELSHNVSQIVRQAFGGQAFGGGGLCLVTSAILVDILNRHDHVESAQLFQGEARAFNKAYAELVERSRRGDIKDLDEASRAERREIQRLMSKAKIVEVHANALPKDHKQPNVKAPLLGHVAVFVTTKTGRYLIDPTAYQFSRSGEQKLPFGRILVTQLHDDDAFETLSKGYRIFPTSRNQNISSHIVYRAVALNSLATLNPTGDNDLNPKRYPEIYAAAMDAFLGS